MNNHQKKLDAQNDDLMNFKTGPRFLTGPPSAGLTRGGALWHQGTKRDPRLDQDRQNSDTPDPATARRPASPTIETIPTGGYEHLPESHITPPTPNSESTKEKTVNHHSEPLIQMGPPGPIENPAGGGYSYPGIVKG